MKKADFVSAVGTNMKRNPRLSKKECAKILDGRKEPRDGSKWDDKVHAATGLNHIDLRYKVGEAAVTGNMSYGQIAEMYSVSKTFVHKWTSVFRARKTLNDGTKCRRINKDVFRSISNRPGNVRSPIRDRIRKEVVRIRRERPFYGSAKIKAKLKINISCSTIDKVLREEGLIETPKKRHTNKTYGSFERPVSMDLVQIDYKEWKGGNYSIWILDDRGRFIMGWRADEERSAENAIELLEETFRFWKIKPRQILSDHGSEFYSVRGGKGRSALDRWCLNNGIEHIHGRVRHPQTQGKIERSHGSAKKEAPYFGKMESLEDLRRTIGEWVEFYNTERPHQALDYAYPLDVFLSNIMDHTAFVEG